MGRRRLRSGRGERKQAAVAASIFVGNLPWGFTAQDLEELFAPHGDVSTVQIVVDRGGRSRGFGFVEMPSDDQASQAISGLNKLAVAGRAIRVAQSRKPVRTR